MSKIILITGGSDGIGAVTAQLAAEQGYIVCINYRQNHIAANKVVEAINVSGGQAYAFQADISSENEVVDMFAAIDAQVGRMTALVNNAGIIESQQKLVDMSAERLQKVFAVNVVGSFLCAREAIKRMSVRNGGNGGSIVNISSMASRLGSPFEYIDYAATKGAIDSMTVGLSKEVAEENIRVNVVRPGTIYTDIHGKAGEPARVERVKAFIPMKRGGQPDEVAKAILWLLSDDASYVTGATLDVAGGR
ncbi:SDR family oxidoreductase [Emticicia sp. 17c]|uniref:SDR family oxidoreductase n=1 Tax=Emticicia sp. 17c TaxID=3127704 RepID=UPI00301D15A9